MNASHGTYDPEYVTTDELGFKTTFRTGNVPFTFNADVFYTNYKDIQVAAGDFNPVSNASGAAVFNAGKAKIKGVEVEGSVVPVTGLEISANYSHLNGSYGRFQIFSPFGQIDCSGGYVVGNVDLSCMPFSYLPKNQFSVSARYQLPVPADIGKLIFNATYAYTGSWINTTTALPSQNPGSEFGSYGLLNFSLNWNGIGNSPVDVGLFMTNASNKTYRTTFTGVWATLAVESSLYGEPRMYGAQVRYHW